MKCKLCDKPHNAKGYCMSHYMKFKRHGDPFGGYKKHDPICIKCDKKHYSMGLCKNHYTIKQHAELRLQLTKIIGNKCVKCGRSDYNVLQFDHIFSGGRKETLKFKGVRTMYRFYKNNPRLAKKRLQLLCVNCNWLKRKTELIGKKKSTSGKLKSILGNRCKNCGEKNIDLLQIDHINNDGKKDRKKHGKFKIYDYYLNNLDEAKVKLQLLCAECNYTKQLLSS